jgi:hypothetical protein
VRHARRGRGGRVVEASETLRRDAPCFCLLCGVAVRLRKGAVREPHFAHKEGEGRPECAEYHYSAGHSVAVQPQAAPDTAAEPPLCIEPAEDWRLYLRIPEIPAYELEQVPLTALLPAGIAVQAGCDAVASVAALDLAPGSVGARAVVPPSADEFLVRPRGEWPPSVHTDRWVCTARGLDTSGVTVFARNRSEWSRLDPEGRVYWGDDVVLLAAMPLTIPSKLRATAMGEVASRRFRWRAWVCALPWNLDDEVAEWLLDHGVDIAQRPWRARMASIPLSAGDENEPAVLCSDAPIVVALEAPHPKARAEIAVTSDPAFLTLEVAAPRDEPVSFVIVNGASAGELRVSACEDDPAPAVGKLAPRPGTAVLRDLLATGPLLSVSVADQAVRGTGALKYCARRGEQPDVLVSLGAGDIGPALSLVWECGARRELRRAMTAGEAARELALLLQDRDVRRIVVDAGAFGRVEVGKAVLDEPARRTASARVAAVLWATAARLDNAAGKAPPWLVRELSASGESRTACRPRDEISLLARRIVARRGSLKG